MFDKLKTAAALLAQAATHPRAALYALRERGVLHVVRSIVGADAVTARDMARDVRFRSLPATIENLSEYYTDLEFTADDLDHHIVRLPSGERFLIRRANGWHDVGALHDTFVKGIYAEHPDVGGSTVIDVGANIGDTAVYFGKRGARVIAYEPDPVMCELARRNAELNGIAADIRNAGIGGENGELSLSASTRGADTMSTTLFPGNEPVNRLHIRTIPIRVVAFAEVLDEVGAVRLVKLDCEGCEYPALLSLPDDALRAVEHIIMEIHGRGDELAQKLRRCGFSVRRDGVYVYADRDAAHEGASSGRPE